MDSSRSAVEESMVSKVSKYSNDERLELGECDETLEGLGGMRVGTL